MRLRVVAFVLLAAAILMAGLGLHAGIKAKLVTVEVSVSGSAVPGTQIFFAANGEFSERDSLVLSEESELSRFRIPVKQVATLRFDPPVGSLIRVCGLRVRIGGVERAFEDYRVTGTHHVAELTSSDGCVVIKPDPLGDDPQAILAIRPERELAANWNTAGVLWLGAALCGFMALLLLSRLRSESTGVSRIAIADRVTGKLVPLYIALSLVFGAAYAVVTPPGAVTDEYAHVTKAMKVSEGVLVGATGERIFPNVFEMYGPFNDYLNPDVHFSTNQLFTQIETPVACEPSTAALPHGADSYAPHLYVAPAASYAFSCATGQNTGTFLVLARMGNLLLATLIIAVGMWATLRARWVLFVCALLPMTMYQVASVSADALSLAFSFAWIGVVCGLLEERIPVSKAFWWLGPLAAAIAISKPGAAWVLSAILFARPVYLRTAGTFFPALLSFLIVPFIVHFLWVLIAAGTASPLAGVDPSANLARLVNDPVGVATVFAQTFFGPHGVWIWKSSLGLLGWLDVYLSPWAYTALSGCMLASLWMAGIRGSLKPWVSSIAIVFSAGAAVMLALPLFIYWTLADSSVVMGLQGRYFLPCLAFAASFFARSSDARIRSALSVAVPFFLMFALADGLIALVERYYP